MNTCDQHCGNCGYNVAEDRDEDVVCDSPNFETCWGPEHKHWVSIASVACDEAHRAAQLAERAENNL